MASPVVVVSGASGLIGRALTAALAGEGFSVRRLVRGRVRDDDEAEWNPDAGIIDARALVGATAVVHLAGENIGHRWTAARRERILASRVRGTSTIARALAQGSEPRPVLISGSAVGYYGDRGDEVVDESSSSGTGFLADVCRQWEAAADPARAVTRVVHIRTGVVISRDGGALERMLLPFRLGLGGPIGSGRQWMSWIALDDHVRAVIHCLRTPSLAGPVNLTAPTPVTNRELTRALASALHRPALLPVPPFALRALFADMADETLLASQRVLPNRLTETGFVFDAPTIDDALRTALR